MNYIETEAYKRIQSAKDHLAQAYADLLVALDEKTTGHRDMKDGYIDRIHNALSTIRDTKKQL